MNMLSKLGLGVLAVVAMAFTNNNLEDGNYTVSLEQSKVEWVGKKVTGQHNGTVAIKDGSLVIKDGMLKGGEFTIDMTTITSTDLEGEYQQKLNGHLKSADFFGVEKYPEAKFVITDVKESGKNGRFSVTGDITIKETTKAISFDAQLVNSGEGIVAVADIVIDRSEFDVRYGSGSFFDNLGDKTIYDDFTLSVNLVTE
jgi:polyisoprenoid-binding protein YceI